MIFFKAFSHLGGGYGRIRTLELKLEMLKIILKLFLDELFKNSL